MKGFLICLGFVAVGGLLFWWLSLPRLRERLAWNTIAAHLCALVGNSKTIAIAASIEGLSALEEVKVIDISGLVGAERANRIAAILGFVMILLRLITRNAVSFKPNREGA